MGNVVKAIGFALLIATARQICVCQSVNARAWVDSTEYLIGDWITVHIQLSHPEGLTFRPIVADTIGHFQVIQRRPLESASETETKTGLVVALYDSGRAILPPVAFLYAFPPDTTARSVSTNPLILTVRTIAVDTTQDIKDVKPPLSIPLTFAEIALYVGIVLLLAAAAVLGYRYWKKRRLKKPEVRYVPPPLPAHVVAMHRLAILKEKKLWQQGLIKEYYSEVTEILRYYVELRFHLRALEQTTDEILEGLNMFHLAPEVIAEMEKILRRADLVKFAKFQPGIPEHEETMTVAYEIVHKTKATTLAAVAPSEPRVKEYVET